MADSSLVHLYTMINKHTKSCWFVGQQESKHVHIQALSKQWLPTHPK